MADTLNNLRTAYHVLADRVTTALSTQVGDAARLGVVRGQATSLSVAAEQVKHYPLYHLKLLKATLRTRLSSHLLNIVTSRQVLLLWLMSWIRHAIAHLILLIQPLSLCHIMFKLAVLR